MVATVIIGAPLAGSADRIPVTAIAAARIAALVGVAAAHLLVAAAPAFVFVVAEPGGDLVAGSLEETAIVASAVAKFVTVALAIAFVRKARLLAPSASWAISVVCNCRPPNIPRRRGAECRRLRQEKRTADARRSGGGTVGRR